MNGSCYPDRIFLNDWRIRHFLKYPVLLQSCRTFLITIKLYLMRITIEGEAPVKVYGFNSPGELIQSQPHDTSASTWVVVQQKTNISSRQIKEGKLVYTVTANIFRAFVEKSSMINKPSEQNAS